MIEIHPVPPETMPTMLAAEGYPDEKLVEQIKLRSGAVIESLFGAKNQVWLSQPESINLLALTDKRKDALSPFIMAQANQADFWLIHWACSFRPASGCEFVRASVEVRLETDAPAAPAGAIAIDMFPREIETPITLKRSLGLSPELKFSFAEVVNAEASLAEIGSSTEYIHYEPEITTFALGEPTPGWDFNKTKARPIRGSRDLFLLVKKPRATALWGRFQLTATLQTSIGRIPLPRFVAGKTAKPVIDERYLFCAHD